MNRNVPMIHKVFSCPHNNIFFIVHHPRTNVSIPLKFRETEKNKTVK